MLLLICTVFLVVLGSCHSKQLSHDMSTWNAIPAFAKHARLWDRSVLEITVANQGHLDHFAALIKKLDDGHPIIASCVGSSFMNDAGCWHTSKHALWDLGVLINPSVYLPMNIKASAKDRAKMAIDHCRPGGFMEAFMDTINQTWPHAQHIFLNNARGGSSLQQYAHGACNDAYMPKALDLIILDPITLEADQASIELLVRRYLKLPSRPLVVLISNSVLTCWSTRYTDWQDYLNCTACVWHRRREFCANRTVDFSRDKVEAWSMTYVAPIQTLAQLYGIPHIVLGPAVEQMVNSVSVQRLLNLSAVEIPTLFYDTPQHLKREELGTMLVADMLVHLFTRGQAALAAMIDGDRSKLRYEVPREVYHARASHIFHNRCYGISLDKAYSVGAAGNATIQEAVKKQLVDEDWASYINGYGAAGHSQQFYETETLPDLHIISNSGWALASHYLDKNGNIKVKPGYEATTAGSTVVFEVNSAFSELPDELVDVLVTYTASYSGWGIVRASCVVGCSCSSADMDAAVTEPVSIHKIQVISNVTQHTQCQLRFEVLPETKSSGHKFKISVISVRLEEVEGGQVGRSS